MRKSSSTQRDSHVSFGRMIEEDSESSRPSSSKARLHRVPPAAFFRYARAFAVAVLISAYLGQQASDGSAKSLTNLVSLVREQPTIRSWWVVAYAFIAYMMFGGSRFLVERSISNISRATSSAITQVTSTEAMSALRSSVSMRSMRLFAGHDDENCGKRRLTLSEEAPFLSISHIALMTLGDVKDVFRYVFECNEVDFNSEGFMAKLREPAKRAVVALELALQQSLGERVQLKPSAKCTEFGSVDALAFIGVCRIFAEWRSVRLVPEGCGRYAFGLGMARRDMVGNIIKVEKAVHKYLDRKVQDAIGETVFSPSIRDILDYEIETKAHPRLPSLGPNTAALGILWLKRQIHYQTLTFSNTLDIPFRFPNGVAAARAAYEEVYGHYHGFIVKQIFQNSFDAAPAANLILQHMNLPRLLGDISEAGEAGLDDEDDDDMWIQLPVDRDSFRNIAIVPQDDHPNPFLDFVGNAVRDNAVRFADFMGQCIGLEGNGHPSLNALATGFHHSLAGLDKLDTTIHTDSTKAAEKDIAAYLFSVRPFLQGLDNLLGELNMNDPLRV